jgi:hypothetical protein
MTTHRFVPMRTVACVFALGLILVSTMPAALAATTVPTVSRASVLPLQLFTNTGVALRPGETVTIRAAGRIHFGQAPIDRVSPAGFPRSVCLRVNRRGQNAHGARTFPDPTADCWSLLGRVGTGPIFTVGAAKTFKVTSKGELLLGVNDNFLPDNRGTWSVVVLVAAPPAKHSSISPLLLVAAAVVLGALIVIVALVMRARRPEPDHKPRARPAAVVKSRGGAAAARKPRARPDPAPTPVEAAGVAVPAAAALRPRGISSVDHGEFTDTNIFEVEFSDRASMRVGYNYFPEGTVVYWRVAQRAHPAAAGEFVTDGGGSTYHFVTLPLEVELEPDPDGADVHFTWAIGGVPFQYSVRRDPAR